MNASSILDAPPPRRSGRSLLASIGAIVVHAGLVALVAHLGTRVVARAVDVPDVTQMIEVDLPQPETPPAEVPRPRVVRLPPTPKPSAEAPPTAAAQAGQVLAAADEVVDFGETLVAGKGDRYAGGVTEAAGTATHAVRDARARAGGVPGGTGTDPLADRTRAPQLAGGAEWDCPFPAEADDLAIDHAVATLRIEVGSDGRVIGVSTTADPGNGFGREARRCALDKPWAPGLDRAGNPTRAVAVVNVRFDR